MILATLLLLMQIPDAVQNEPIAEKRYQLALDTATKAAVDKNYNLAAEASEFALKSLEDMGKPPHKNGGNYKKAELRTREILRRVDALIKEAGIDERPTIEAAQSRINTVHEKLLEGVMSKKP
ncbi:MAG: hypothetical protein FJW36_10430 [Acidobacteria bacterium]|nr:hypothetical protein [Acidobacteriota bacterium]